MGKHTHRNKMLRTLAKEEVDTFFDKAEVNLLCIHPIFIKVLYKHYRHLIHAYETKNDLEEIKKALLVRNLKKYEQDLILRKARQKATLEDSLLDKDEVDNIKSLLKTYQKDHVELALLIAESTNYTIDEEYYNKFTLFLNGVNSLAFSQRGWQNWKRQTKLFNKIIRIGKRLQGTSYLILSLVSNKTGNLLMLNDQSSKFPLRFTWEELFDWVEQFPKIKRLIFTFHTRDVELNFPEGLQLPLSVDFLEINGRLSKLTLPDSFAHYSQLKSLAILGTGWKRIPKQIFKLYQLENLYLQGNLLEEIDPEISALRNLRLLQLNYCIHLKYLPKEVLMLPQLTQLSIEHTQIDHLPLAFVDSMITTLHVNGGAGYPYQFTFYYKHILSGNTPFAKAFRKYKTSALVYFQNLDRDVLQQGASKIKEWMFNNIEYK
ncbi:MAG: hypothetical protein MK212_03885 [Saprospiraceae bacterium]|nr:hypothetical protein [Saprospiraceae bacterium]